MDAPERGAKGAMTFFFSKCEKKSKKFLEERHTKETQKKLNA